MKRSQLAKIALIAAFLLIAPLLSTSMRPPFLYVIFNLLIMLGAESGVLSAISSPSYERKPVTVARVATTEASPGKSSESSNESEHSVKTVEKNAAVVKAQKVKKCPSMPSLFFIGSGDVEKLEENEDDGDDEYEDDGDQLFAKAETFIGNFYKQLKIQREESWKKIHGPTTGLPNARLGLRI